MLQYFPKGLLPVNLSGNPPDANPELRVKQLILVRHAKSDWGDPALGDHERPLNKRGLRNAPEMGERFAKREVHPDRIYTSSALRARTTAKIIAEALDYPAEDIEQVEGLYHAGVDTWLDFISGLEDSLSCVMCFGHNPGLTELAHFEFGCELSNIPTCGVLTLDFAADHWAKVPGTQPDQVDFDYPKKEPTN